MRGSPRSARQVRAAEVGCVEERPAEVRARDADSGEVAPAEPLPGLVQDRYRVRGGERRLDGLRELDYAVQVRLAHAGTLRLSQ